MSGYASPRAVGIADVYVPKRRPDRLDRRDFKFAIARQAGSKAGLARSHRIALPGNRKRCGARAAKISRNQRKVVDGGHCDRALGRVIDAHGPADEGGLGVAVQARNVHDVVFRKPGNFSDSFRGEVRDKG